MVNKKVIGLFLSLILVLCMVLPGTLAASADMEGAVSEFSIGADESTEQDSAEPQDNAENGDASAEENDAAAEDEADALKDDQNANADAHSESADSAAAPAAENGTTNDMPVISEIIYPTVNFDNVAPFGAPVEG